jgi:uncharacterized protein (UPF0332 family)
VDAIKGLISKVEKNLEMAEELFNGRYYDFAVSRGYYSMLYCAEALLLSKGLKFPTDSEVISAFGERFIKTKLLPEELHAYILDIFSQRGRGGRVSPLEKEDVRDVLDKAKIFLERTKEYLKTQGIVE